MTVEYKSMEFRVWCHRDGNWEWVVPELNISGRHLDENRAIADAKTFIDHWLERLH